MNARSMTEREPFYEILQNTTNEYGKTVFSEETEFSEKIDGDKKKMHFFMLPSFVSAFPISKGTREFLYSEYNIRGNIIKFLVGKLGVFAITHSGKLFSKKTFCCSRKSKALEKVMISPCNRSIRYFHFDSGYVDCVVKNMYGNRYMQNQLRFRLQGKYDFVPKIISYGDRWYREEIMHGNPLARVTDNKKFYASQKTVLDYMGQIADDTLTKIKSKEYIGKLEEEYFEIIKTFLPEIETELCFLGKSLFKKTYNGNDLADMDIPVVLSHGDLQAGNIWVKKDGKTVIYDWETVKPRSVWFDPATLILNLHSCEFMQNSEALIIDDDRIFINDVRKEYSTEEKKIIAQVILIENILFYLDDIAQIPAEYSENVCRSYIEKMKKDFIRRGIIGE